MKHREYRRQQTLQWPLPWTTPAGQAIRGIWSNVVARIPWMLFVVDRAGSRLWVFATVKTYVLALLARPQPDHFGG